MPGCTKKSNWAREGRVLATLAALGIVAAALIAFLLIFNRSQRVSEEEATSIEETREIFNLLADGKYTEVFTRIKSGDEMVLSYLRAVLYDKGYGTTMNVNMHDRKVWNDLLEIEKMRKSKEQTFKVLDRKYAVLGSFIEEKAKGGDPIFQILTAYLARLGIGRPSDKPNAAEWYRLAANQNNDPLAMCELGRMHSSPIGGIEKSDKKALALFEKAAKQDYAVGENEFAILLSEGNDDEENTKKFES